MDSYSGIHKDRCNQIGLINWICISVNKINDEQTTAATAAAVAQPLSPLLL